MKKSIILILLSMLCLQGYSQIKNEVYTFHPDSEFFACGDIFNLYPNNTFRQNGGCKTNYPYPPSGNLWFNYKFNKTVVLDSIKVSILSANTVRNNGWLEFIKCFDSTYFIPSVRVGLTSDTLYYYPLSPIYHTWYFNKQVDSVNIESVAIKEIPSSLSYQLRFRNLSLYYHYNTTGISEIKNAYSYIKYVNGSFISDENISNIKIYDVVGTLIKEGDLNTVYNLENNKIYFVLFDNKQFIKYCLTE